MKLLTFIIPFLLSTYLGEALATWASLGGPLRHDSWPLTSTTSKMTSTCPKQEKISDRFLVIGHAGGDPVNHCENTIEATESALELGANAIEIDLSFSADDVIFLWHDADPNSAMSVARSYGFALPGKCTPITRSNKPTWRMTYREILHFLSYKEPQSRTNKRSATFPRGGSSARRNAFSKKRSILRHQRPPSLETWMSLYAKDSRIELIWLDVKTSPEVFAKFVGKLVELLDKYEVSPSKLVLSVDKDEKAVALRRALLRESFSPDLASRVVSDTVSLSPWVNSVQFLNGIQKGSDACGCCANLGAPVFAHNRWDAFKSIVGINVRERELNTAATLGSRMNVFTWTIDDEAEMTWLVKAGVDGIITNKPGALAQIAARVHF